MRRRRRGKKKKKHKMMKKNKKKKENIGRRKCGVDVCEIVFYDWFYFCLFVVLTIVISQEQPTSTSSSVVKGDPLDAKVHDILRKLDADLPMGFHMRRREAGKYAVSSAEEDEKNFNLKLAGEVRVLDDVVFFVCLFVCCMFLCVCVCVCVLLLLLLLNMLKHFFACMLRLFLLSFIICFLFICLKHLFNISSFSLSLFQITELHGSRWRRMGGV